ncbi:MAG: PH domain-containing protein [Lachnospiraceae bacterium]|nr:PH domain-containing protein [Lachnospiraceae bacterium]
MSNTIDINSVDEIVENKRIILFGLPWTFTKYYIKKDVITIDAGFLKKVEDDCYMYKVQDVELQRNFFQRLAGLGCVVCYTGDTTHPTLRIHNIKNSREVKEFILKYSEEARLKRRTINTLNISADDITDID